MPGRTGCFGSSWRCAFGERHAGLVGHAESEPDEFDDERTLRCLLSEHDELLRGRLLPAREHRQFGGTMRLRRCSVEVVVLAGLLGACSGGGKTAAKPVAPTTAPTTFTTRSSPRSTPSSVARTTTTRAMPTATTKSPEVDASTATTPPAVAVLHRPPEAVVACVHDPTGYVAGFDYGPGLPSVSGTSLNYSLSLPWATGSSAPQSDGKWRHDWNRSGLFRGRDHPARNGYVRAGRVW